MAKPLRVLRQLIASFGPNVGGAARRTRNVSSRPRGPGGQDGRHQLPQRGYARSTLRAAAQSVLQLLQALRFAAMAVGQCTDDGWLGHVQAGADLAACRLQGHRRLAIWPQQLAA
jgi:hypothetical protein